jgi:hypothetical protein
MAEKLSLKSIENRAWKSVYQDGIWDIYLGLLLMAMAINTWIARTGLSEGVVMGLYIGMMLLAMGVLFAGKRFITVPRLGRVKFTGRRKIQIKRTRLILTASVLVGIIAFLVTVYVLKFRPAWFNFEVMIGTLWVVNVLAVFGLAGYWLQFKRLYLVGAMYAISVPLDMYITKTFDVDIALYTFGIPALVILVVGTVVLVRFIRSTPPLRIDQVEDISRDEIAGEGDRYEQR